ncbi:MAG: chromosomal replication initiator protein DnaA [Nitrospinae bacterium]|nr:chromosomal replication initiator protein DnaA [Nitrospinota bacterium]
MTSFWDDCKKELEKRIDPHNFLSYIQPVSALEMKDGELSLRVPSMFFADWIEKHYLDSIREVMGLQGRAETKVKFVVDAQKPKVEVRAPAVVKHKKKALPALFKPQYSFDSFVVGKSNEFAYASALQCAKKPGTQYNPLYLYGGVGLGKTHLVQSIGRHILEQNPDAKVMYLSSDQWVNQLISRIQKGQMEEFRNTFRNLDVLLVDDIQFIAGKERTQEEFFHTFNELHHAGKQIVISSDQFPKDIKKLEDRLKSRFASGLIADIQPADLETKIAIINKKAATNGYAIPPDVAEFLAETIKSNIRELEGCMARVVAMASLTGKPIDLAIARETLEGVYANEKKNVDTPMIQRAVIDHFSLKPTDLKSKGRARNIVIPRQLAMFLCREYTEESLPHIGKAFGGRDHSTVIHAHQKIKKEIETNTRLYKDLTEIKKKLDL